MTFLKKILCFLLVIILIVPAVGCLKAPRRIGEPYSKFYIEQELEKRNGLTDVSWSPDNRYVAFTDQTAIDMLLILYVWKVGEELIKTDLKGNLTDISWSSDSRYFTVNEKGNGVGHTYIILAEGEEIVDSISNVADTIWSPNSDKLLASVESDVQISVPGKLENPLDLVLYDLNTRKMTVLLEANSDFYYLPKSWDKENLIEYEKKYFGSNKSESLEYTIKGTK